VYTPHSTVVAELIVTWTAPDPKTTNGSSQFWLVAQEFVTPPALEVKQVFPLSG
jgi:hypothetical protein